MNLQVIDILKSIVILAFQLSPLSLSSGLEWVYFKPLGRDLGNSDELAKALAQGKTVFTEEEWAQFGISNMLRPDDFIKAGDFYFKPAPNGQPLGRNWEEAKPSLLGRDLGKLKGGPALAKELAEGKTDFTEKEWARFGINELRPDDFITGGDFFKPAPKGEQELDPSIKTEEELQKFLQTLRRSGAIWTKKRGNSPAEESESRFLRYREYLVKEEIICRHLTNIMEEIRNDGDGELVAEVFRSNELASELNVPEKSMESWTRHVCQLVGDLVAILDPVPRSQLVWTLELVKVNTQTFLHEMGGAHRGESQGALINIQSSDPRDSGQSSVV